MTREEWLAGAEFFLDAHGVQYFTPQEVCDVGKKHKGVRLYAPPVDLTLNALELIEGPLNWLRWHRGGAPVTVTSWYRSLAYNAAVGGSRNSMHKVCGAADITKKGWTPAQVAHALDHDYPMADQLGIGLYKTFTHVDSRGLIGRKAPARWSGKGVGDWWLDKAA